MAVIEIKSEITGSVWKIVAAPGSTLQEDDEIMILESMKMEIPVVASEDGVLKEILVSEEDIVTDGKVVATMEV